MVASKLTAPDDPQTGTKSVLYSTSVCKIGLEISKFLKLVLSTFGFLGSELYLLGLSFSFGVPRSATPNEGVLLTLDISLEIPDLSAACSVGLFFSFRSTATPFSGYPSI